MNYLRYIFYTELVENLRNVNIKKEKEANVCVGGMANYRIKWTELISAHLSMCVFVFVLLLFWPVCDECCEPKWCEPVDIVLPIKLTMEISRMIVW